ncbi:MAG: hypothetical protein K2H01_09335 [Ruminococcus sp.]|nr:hypothetical protein [Ruminococcus sp.]
MDKLKTENYKVVKIIDDMNIILNCGDSDGINIGDIFNIYSNTSVVVTDPDTGDFIDELFAIKAKVQAVQIFDKMCICQSAYTDFAIAALGMNIFKGKRSTLNVDPAQITGGLDPNEDEYIRIGDKVIKK